MKKHFLIEIVKIKFRFSNVFKLQIELLSWPNILTSWQLKFKYSFLWKVSLCLSSFCSYLQICVLCQFFFFFLMCFLQFLIYCSFSPEVSAINLFCVHVGGKKQFSKCFQTCSFSDSEKWIYKFPKGVSLGKKTEDFLNYYLAFCCLSCRKLLFSYGKLQEWLNI